MARLALIKDGVVLNVIEVEADTVVFSDIASKGDLFDGTIFSKPPIDIPQE